MILKVALHYNGYTPEDLYHKLRNRGHQVSRTTVNKTMYASGPNNTDNTHLWEAILDCLDDMGVDWKMRGVPRDDGY